MLEHSRVWERMGATLVVAASNQLPLADSSVQRVVASLGDPYNEPSFWTESKRVLEPDGLVIFTTPSHEWAFAFRRDPSPGSGASRAEFVLRNGHRGVDSVDHPLRTGIRFE